MKIFSKIKHLSKKIIAAGVVVVAVSGFMAIKTASADVSVSTPVDCDTNAVIFCGATSTSTLVSKYTNGDGKNSAASIHNIFSAFGITSTELAGMRTTAVAGSVTKSGDVFVNGELVATGAVTAGRSFITGSTKVVFNGTTFYKRATSVSFQSASLQAYVVMVNGKFSHAVLASCGNPVVAIPKTPNYTIAKTVRVKGQSTWVKAVTVNPGTHVEYRVVVASSGQVSVKNVIARDTLPTNVTYVDNTLRRDGAVVAADSNFFSAAGNLITSLAPGKSVSYIFEAIVGASDTVSSCVPQTLVNTGVMTSPGLPTKSDTANVSKTCLPKLPKPVFSCDAFDVTKGDNRTITVSKLTFTATGGATFKNAVIDWGDSTAPLPPTVNVVGQTHTFAVDDSFTVQATVHFMVAGEEVTDSGNCAKTVVFSPTTPQVLPATDVLPSTGPSGIIGIFAGTSVLASLGYYVLVTRRELRG